jgi:hypothetical protein
MITNTSECAARRFATKCGLSLEKFRGSNEDARAGSYMLVDGRTGAVVHATWGMGYGLDLDDAVAFCEHWLGMNRAV